MYTCTVTIVQDKTKTGNIKNYINVKLNLSDLLVYVINTNFILFYFFQTDTWCGT